MKRGLTSPTKRRGGGNEEALVVRIVVMVTVEAGNDLGEWRSFMRDRVCLVDHG